MIVRSTPLTPTQPGENRLLAALSDEERNRLFPLMRTVHLRRDQVIHLAGGAIDWICFPVTAVLALVITLQDGSSSGLGTVAQDGMAGLPVLLGVASSPFTTVVQVAGDAYLLRAGAFRDEIARHGGMERLLHRYTHLFVMQVAQGLTCHSHHSLKQRLATWLLNLRDTSETNQLPITHELLAQLLGVTRPSVTLTADVLQTEGLIGCHRGLICLIDRPGLEKVACECYDHLAQEYERLFGHKRHDVATSQLWARGVPSDYGDRRADRRADVRGERRGNGDGYARTQARFPGVGNADRELVTDWDASDGTGDGTGAGRHSEGATPIVTDAEDAQITLCS